MKLINLNKRIMNIKKDQNAILMLYLMIMKIIN